MFSRYEESRSDGICLNWKKTANASSLSLKISKIVSEAIDLYCVNVPADSTVLSVWMVSDTMPVLHSPRVLCCRLHDCSTISHHPFYQTPRLLCTCHTDGWINCKVTFLHSAVTRHCFMASWNTPRLQPNLILTVLSANGPQTLARLYRYYRTCPNSLIGSCR